MIRKRMDFSILIFATLLPVVVLLVYIYRKDILPEPTKGLFDVKNHICVIDSWCFNAL